jgi:hypothetical protein
MYKTIITIPFLLCLITSKLSAQKIIKHTKAFTITPQIIKNSTELSADKNCELKIINTIEENAKTNILCFDGTENKTEGQVDPQIAVGGNYVVHASNVGVSIYDKKGNLKKAMTLNCFTKSKDCFDPKIFYDSKNKYFGLGVWDGYNINEKKPMRLLFSQTDNPLLGWNRYSLPANDGTDGGSIGFGAKWIVYRYDDDFVLLLNAIDCKKGKPTKIYKFNTPLGQPIFNQDNGNSFAFYIDQDNKNMILQTIVEQNGVPYISELWMVSNNSIYYETPPFSAQLGTEKLISSGDFKPKNAVIQNNSLWFSHIVNKDGNSGIEWFQLSAKNGAIIQQGIIAQKGTNYIQPTIAVNKRGDMAIGFQETNENMHISARAVYRLANDKINTTRKIIEVAEGNSPYINSTNQELEQAWGDYTGSMVDGDNGIDFWFAQSIAKDNKAKVKIYRLKL